MNKCPECRMLIQDGIAFCPNCKARIPGVAPRARQVELSSRSASIPLGPRKTPTTAVVGLVLSMIPLFFISMIGVILGIVALVKISSQPKLLRGRGVAIAAIVLGSVWVLLAVVAALSLPSFLEYQARAKQAEARDLLRQIQLAQDSYKQINGRYAGKLALLNISGQVHYYAIFMGDDELQPEEPYQTREPSHASEQSFRAVAVSNLDGDPMFDIWAIDQTGRLDHIQNDVE